MRDPQLGGLYVGQSVAIAYTDGGAGAASLDTSIVGLAQDPAP
jgi:hypothetical protein